MLIRNSAVKQFLSVSLLKDILMNENKHKVWWIAWLIPYVILF